MTKREAFVAAVRRETPDQVPFAPLIHCRYAHRVLGRSDWRAVYEVHREVGSTHHRGPIGLGVRSSLPEGYGSRTELLSTTPEGRTETAWTIRTPRRGMHGRIVAGTIPHDPLVSKTVEYPVKSEDDWRAYLALRQHWLDGVQGPEFGVVPEAVRTMGEDGVASVGLGPAYTALASVRGMVELMLDLEDYPDLMAELFEVERRIMEHNVRAFLASPAEVSWLDICWATGSVMGPDRFRRWALPDVQRAMALVMDVPGKHMGLYTLGRMRQLLPMLVDAGVDFIETLEPNEGDITLGEAMQLYGQRVCLMGNFDCVVLARGSVDDARREARRCLREGMDGGGYVLATGDEVPADAKMDNLKAIVEVVEEHGRY